MDWCSDVDDNGTTIDTYLCPSSSACNGELIAHHWLIQPCGSQNSLMHKGYITHSLTERLTLRTRFIDRVWWVAPSHIVLGCESCAMSFTCLLRKTCCVCKHGCHHLVFSCVLAFISLYSVTCGPERLHWSWTRAGFGELVALSEPCVPLICPSCHWKSRYPWRHLCSWCLQMHSNSVQTLGSSRPACAWVYYPIFVSHRCV